ncbi:hypothetical protein GOBAR_AA21314 [Gossypium barbadense]|uniref:Uncharacterized protein n=1 Tax=Gossypium barbadense TaxID=3634 RepID=A0A2P5X7P3_GOSBA|nr:hypothetical protein GOBAR_AA21314 [Gossypium barbadense]
MDQLGFFDMREWINHWIKQYQASGLSQQSMYNAWILILWQIWKHKNQVYHDNQQPNPMTVLACDLPRILGIYNNDHPPPTISGILAFTYNYESSTFQRRFCNNKSKPFAFVYGYILCRATQTPQPTPPSQINYVENPKRQSQELSFILSATKM